jgi:hypothetical protein
MPTALSRPDATHIHMYDFNLNIRGDFVGLSVDGSVVLEQTLDRSMIRLSALAHYAIQLWNFVKVVTYFRLKGNHGISCSSD